MENILHPTQRKVVKKHFNGPARILGGAGTGKLLLRCTEQKNWLGHYNQGKDTFTTYTRNLAEDIKDNLRKICTNEEMKKLR